MTKIAVVGAGYWGKNLIRNLDHLGVLSAICERNTDNPNLSPYREVKLFTQYDELLCDPEIDGIAISTPAEMHYDMVKKALLADKHVFVEKPLCLFQKQGVELNEMSQSRKRVLMVGHLLQYHPAFLKLRQIIVDGDLGKLEYIYSNRLNLGRIRTEENILWSFAPHDISAMLALAGSMPRTVSTTGGQYLNPKIADVTLSSLSFDNGIRGHIFVSWLHPYKEQKLIVVGSKGMAVFNDTARPEEKLLVYPHHIDWKYGTMPTPVKENAVPVSYEIKEPLNEECGHFLECIRTGATPRTDGNEGLRVLQVLNASQRSLDQNGIPVILGEADHNNFIHPTAVIDEPSSIGEATTIWHFSHVLKGSCIGKNCKIGQNVMIGPNALIGNNVKIQNNVSVYEGVIVEDDVFCGPSMVFTNVFNPRSEIARMKELRKTVVRRGATIGANATIVCGNTIGRYAFIGAGAVVTKDVPDFALVMGNPARQKGWICRCGEKLSLTTGKASCDVCKLDYKLKNNILEVETADMQKMPGLDLNLEYKDMKTRVDAAIEKYVEKKSIPIFENR